MFVTVGGFALGVKMQTIGIKLCDSVDEAPIYKPEQGYKAATLTDAVIVRGGTQQGNMTVDLVFIDALGNKFVAMTTLNIIDSIHYAGAGFKQRHKNNESKN